MVSVRKIYVKKRIIEKRYMVAYLPSWLVIGKKENGGFMHGNWIFG